MNNILFLLLTVIILFKNCFCSYSKYKETEQDIKDRLKFLAKYRKEISNNKIKFSYSKKYGVMCIAETPLDGRYNNILQIPFDFIISGCKWT